MQRYMMSIGIAAFLALAAAPVWSGDASRAKISLLNDTLLDVMKNADTLGFNGRLAKLEPVMTDIYDFGFMAKVAVGGYWKKLDAGGRVRLQDAFSRMSIATYAARFDGFSGERFEIVSDEKSVRDTVLVKTNLIKSDGSPIALNYLTRANANGEWRIIDVFLDARFSELARLRADYTAVIQRQGFDKLIETIESKISQMTPG